MSQVLPDVVNRHTGGIQVACIGLSHLVRAFRSLALPFGIFLQDIGNLPGRNSLPISHKDVFAGVFHLLKKVDGFRNQWNKTVPVGFRVFHDFILVRLLIPRFLPDDVKVLDVTIVRPF